MSKKIFLPNIEFPFSNESFVLEIHGTGDGERMAREIEALAKARQIAAEAQVALPLTLTTTGT